MVISTILIHLFELTKSNVSFGILPGTQTSQIAIGSSIFERGENIN